MRLLFAASLLLACCKATSIAPLSEPVERPPEARSTCDEMLSPRSPEPETAHVQALAWIGDRSSLVASVLEGDGAAHGCRLDREPQRAGLVLYQAGKIAKAYRGVHVETLAPIEGTHTVMVSGERLGLGTIDLETGCLRRTAVFSPRVVAFDGKRGRLFSAQADLTATSARTLMRLGSVKLPRPAHAIAYDDTTDSVVVLIDEDTEHDRLAVYDAGSLESRGFLDFPAAKGSRLLAVRPGHGEVVVGFDTPCTKWKALKLGSKSAPVCLEGASHGLLRARLDSVTEVSRTDVAGPLTGGWLDGERFALRGTTEAIFRLWSPSVAALEKRSAPFPADSIVALHDGRIAGQASDASLRAIEWSASEPLFSAPLPHADPKTIPVCDLK